jgi:hypothetical protein
LTMMSAIETGGYCILMLTERSPAEVRICQSAPKL